VSIVFEDVHALYSHGKNHVGKKVRNMNTIKKTSSFLAILGKIKTKQNKSANRTLQKRVFLPYFAPKK
jgi:hypothetical protein